MNSSFYIDVEKALRLGLNKRITVWLNGKKINKCVAAKSGKNGFVDFIGQHIKVKGDSVATTKKRGLVKISISHSKE